MIILNNKKFLFFLLIFFSVIFFGLFSYFSEIFQIKIVSVSLSSNDYLISNNYIIYFQKPMLYVLGISICFYVEYLVLGWKNCSLNSIVNFSSASSRTDIFYIWIKISGLTDIAFNLVFLGFGFYLISIISNHSLFKIDNYFIEFIITIFLITLIHYFYHRGLHHPLFWELHKLHHSADEMNIFTASREHPLVISIYTMLICIPSAIFGVRPEVIFIYKALEGFYNLFLHSKVDLFPQFTSKFMITTSDHHIHHSTNPEHFNKNYGMVLNIWDRLFLSYYKPNNKEKIHFGIDDINYKKDIYVRDIFLIINRWLLDFKTISKKYFNYS
jgi:sterol desaturase/sphingolipid hydroxylase (fatty acid hydroxylase superfamily)